MIADTFGSAAGGRFSSERKAPVYTDSDIKKVYDSLVNLAHIVRPSGGLGVGGCTSETYRRLIMVVWFLAPEAFCGVSSRALAKELGIPLTDLGAWKLDAAAFTSAAMHRDLERAKGGAQ
jgi:hypothetical protein